MQNKIYFNRKSARNATYWVSIKFIETRNNTLLNFLQKKTCTQLDVETFSSVNVYKWRKTSKDGQERVENYRSLKTSTTQEMVFRINTVF